MSICDTIKGIGGFLISAGFISLAVHIITRPNLKNPSWGKTILNVQVLEKNDVTYNSTNGSPEVSVFWKEPVPITYTFIYVTIENAPLYRWNSTAKGVSAEVTCVDEDGQKISYFSRPMNTNAPGANTGYGDIEASKVDIPAGKPLRGYYIAFYLPSEDKFFGFSPQAYHLINFREDKKIYYDWKDPNLMMDRDKTYKTTIRFSAENITKSFEYEFELSLKKDS